MIGEEASTAQISERDELWRKLIHSAASVGAAGILVLDPFGYGRMIIAAGAATAVTVEILRRVSPQVGKLFTRSVGRMLRERERNGISGGATLAIGTLAAALAAPPMIAGAGILIAGLADAAAAIVGRRFGRTRIAGGKSLEGSVACFSTAFLIALAIPGTAPLGALATALAVTLLEALKLPFDDNLYLPLFTALALRLAIS